jgi:hypothetical protein
MNNILLENSINFILASKEQKKRNNTVRVIYDYNNTKTKKQYELLFNILPKHELYIYKHEENIPFTETTYNIYLDTINEFCYNNLKARYTILFVNEEYVSYKYSQYIRRERYKNAPLIKIDSIIDYYFCVTKYSIKILLKKYKIQSHKIIYLTNILNINKKLLLKKKLSFKLQDTRYILFDLDIYDSKNNIAILEIWLKYYINIKTMLVIQMNDIIKNDKIIDKLKLLYGNISFDIPFTKYYNNIIITNDLNSLNIDCYAIILNMSSYNLYYKVYNYILLKKIIIVNDNKITREIFNNKQFLYSDINQINNNIDLLLNLSIDDITDIENYLRYKKSNIKKIFTYFKHNKKKYIEPLFNSPDNRLVMNTDQEIAKNNHEKLIPYILKIEKKFNTFAPNIEKYFRFIKKPKNKTNNCYATIIIIDNSYLPSILVSGYKLKQITELNTICFVQDQPYYENGKKIFSGLSYNDIKEIKQIYDCVIGIDIINKYFNDYQSLLKQFINNKNEIYKLTKMIIFSFIYYEKIFYYDASVLININMDSIFSNNTNVLQIDKDIENSIIEGCYLIIPKKYYIFKFLYIIEHYDDIFNKNIITNKLNMYLYLIFYTIYPNFETFNYFQDNIQNEPIINYPYKTPFRYSIIFNEKERDLFLLNYKHYLPWDIVANELIKKYPTFKKIFRYIKTFRYTKFTI